MATAATAPSQPSTIYRKDLEEWDRLEKERLRLGREQTAVASQQKEIAKRAEAFLKANGGKDRSVVRSGYRLSFIKYKGSVAWAKVVMRRLGMDIYEEEKAAVPEKDKLVIERIK